MEIKKQTSKLKKLTLRKLVNVLHDDLDCFFENSDFSNLVELNFYDCPKFTTKCLVQLSKTSKNLEDLNISWSELVDNDGISSIFTQCPKIRYVITQGCKKLNDDILHDYVNEKRRINYIQLMDFTKCDYIQDKTLLSLSGIYPTASFINYYGDEFRNKRKLYKD